MIKASNNPFSCEPNDQYPNKVDRGGYTGTAKDLDDKINLVAFPDDFLVIGEIVKTVNIVSIQPLTFQWRIDQAIFENQNAFSTVIAPATNGLKRIDIIVATNFGSFIKIQGIESIDSAQEPPTPENTLRVTFISVFGSEVSEAAVTIIGAEVLNNKLDRAGYTGTAMTLYQQITSLDENLNTRIDDVAYEFEVIKLPLKSDKLTTYTKTETDSFITQLLGGAPADANTLKELNDKILAVQAIIGSADPDANLLVDTVKELLAVFSTFPEGVDLVNLLAGKVNTTDIYNALNSVVAGKVLDARQGKVLKDLIDALAITVSNISSNVVTTIKPILSTALASQNVAGFVTYINALNPVLVVGTSEIVKYNLTDTGRVFELNVRGRSFGTGQPAIVAADVLEVTDFLNKDIRLNNYPSTRNDGQLPTNRVLSTDANGNLKMYTIATSPAPFLEVLVPDSTLPSTTTNFTLKGAFFTPTMTVAIAGQTVHYITFKSDNLVLVNVTTGPTEGSYAVTLNNGIQAVFENALLITLGTVFIPEIANWVNIVQPIEVQKGQALVKTANSIGTAELNYLLDRTKRHSIYFNITKSPLITPVQDSIFTMFSLIDTVNGDIYDFNYLFYNSGGEYYVRKNGVMVTGSIGWSNSGFSNNMRFYWDLTQMYIYKGQILIYTFSAGNFPNTLKARFRVQQLENTGIKYVEHF